MMSEIKDLPFGVRDFIYLEREKLMFMALSDMNIASRIDAYITNTNFPWEKKTDSHVTVGAVLCFKVVATKEKYSYEKLWLITYPVQIGCLNWEDSLNLLSVGFDDGKIICYKVPADTEYRQHDKTCEIQAHKNRVMGIAVEARTGYIYSASSDEKLVTSEMNYQEKVTETTVGTAGCNSLVYDRKNQRLFTCTEKGEVVIYSTARVKT